MNQHVDMISHAIHRVCFTLKLANQATKVGMQLCSDVGSDQWFPIFCAENDMGNKMCEGSAHNFMPPAVAGSGHFTKLTHSLRCGLEECRQLCWLDFACVLSADHIGLICAPVNKAKRQSLLACVILYMKLL